MFSGVVFQDQNDLTAAWHAGLSTCLAAAADFGW